MTVQSRSSSRAIRKKLPVNRMRDVVIIGGGIAGISAALYATRASLDFVLLEGVNLGGQLSFIEKVENYPAMATMSGYEFIQSLCKQLEYFSVPVLSKKAESVQQQKDGSFLVQCSDEQISCRSVLISTGAVPQKLSLAEESRFEGKGISYCAVCDGYFYKNKIVAVVGGGNTALEEALYLSRIAREVIIVHRRDAFRGFPSLVQQIQKTSNISVRYNSVVHACHGQEVLQEVVVSDVKTGVKTSIPLSGMFVAIGYVPNTECVAFLVTRDEKGFIVTDERLAASCPGVFACGDCRQRPVKQLITAAAEGASAALRAYEYLKGRES